jgi:hypothetical protein
MSQSPLPLLNHPLQQRALFVNHLEIPLSVYFGGERQSLQFNCTAGADPNQIELYDKQDRKDLISLMVILLRRVVCIG